MSVPVHVDREARRYVDKRGGRDLLGVTEHGVGYVGRGATAAFRVYDAYTDNYESAGRRSNPRHHGTSRVLVREEMFGGRSYARQSLGDYHSRRRRY